MKRALITGVHGQDGSYLSEYLLSLGYEVFGMSRRPETLSTPRDGDMHLLYGDMCDSLLVETCIRKSWPDEIYNLAGQVYVPVSWEHPAETFDINTSGLERILHCVERIKPDTRVYQASSSEMFGNVNGTCNEQTPLNPMSPYGVSKAASHRLCELYRQRGLFVVSGMLFNHESPRRGHEMVTRKIARHVAKMYYGSTGPLHLGNMQSRRDWGFAGDYVRAMHLMLQQEKAEDFVIGTGESHSVEDFVIEACKFANLDRPHIEQDKYLTRTQEIWDLRADPKKAREKLGWEPKTRFWGLVQKMVRAEIDALRDQQPVSAT